MPLGAALGPLVVGALVRTGALPHPRRPEAEGPPLPVLDALQERLRLVSWACRQLSGAAVLVGAPRPLLVAAATGVLVEVRSQVPDTVLLCGERCETALDHLTGLPPSGAVLVVVLPPAEVEASLVEAGAVRLAP